MWVILLLLQKFQTFILSCRPWLDAVTWVYTLYQGPAMEHNHLLGKNLLEWSSGWGFDMGRKFFWSFYNLGWCWSAHLNNHRQTYKTGPEAHEPQWITWVNSNKSLIQLFSISVAIETNQNVKFVQNVYARRQTTQQTFLKTFCQNNCVIILWI